jgi:hypothetical protein
VTRWTELKQPEGTKHGMCMAVALFRPPGQDALHAAVGYEDGTLALWDTASPKHALMSTRLHSEPIMALAIDAKGTGVLQLRLASCCPVAVLAGYVCCFAPKPSCLD